ncbi:MAG: T9SS type A sorting domain-containing protein [Candidatus Delongbacteria bacterium]|nr:T9SS type A sorting domain-containing protein [Candidatus Delongbacteria bacterium]MBN2833833.1 T9SS type A sorting domain-containing protein [Candidatus Delongbacteria bacterium]
MKKIFFLSLTIILSLSAALINIPQDFPTIQNGLNAASTNDTVYVADGIYYENLIWPAIDGIKLIGSSKEQCIIDGNQSHGVIHIGLESNWIIGQTTLIENFTIQNGSTEEGGGGIYLINSEPQFKNLIIKNNSARHGGGVMCFNYSHAYFENVTIMDNTAQTWGGGIAAEFTSNIVLENVHIIGNTVGLYRGGGLWVGGGSHVIAKHTLIANNFANVGGGVYSGSKGSLSLENCTITNNWSSVKGGGIGVQEAYMAYPQIVNSIIWGNSPDQIIGDINITYSDIQDGWSGESNIDLNPLFIDSANEDYHLTVNSPCIDTGNPDSTFDPDNTIADMGAFFYDQSVEIDENTGNMVDGLELSNYPNPFNPITHISFNLEKLSKVNIVIYNIEGKKVNTITNNSFDVGKHSVSWNGTNGMGHPVSAGIYYYKIIVNNEMTSTKSCLLLK